MYNVCLLWIVLYIKNYTLKYVLEMFLWYAELSYMQLYAQFVISKPVILLFELSEIYVSLADRLINWLSEIILTGIKNILTYA